MYENVEWGQDEQLDQGPSKGDIMLAFMSREPLTFRSTGHYGFVQGRPEMLMHEDGSGQSFIIEGYVESGSGRKFHAYWHAGSKHGHIKIEMKIEVHVG